MDSRSLRFGLALSIALAAPAAGDIAVTIGAGAPDNIFPNGGTTHGWQFSVNAPLLVTHLGLYDRFLNGFTIEHPVGLWDQEGALLGQAVLGPGAGNILVDNFRYVDITDDTGPGPDVILKPGLTYTIGFYSETFNQSDGMVIFDGFHTIDPSVNYVGVGVADFTDGLEMPATPDEFGLHRWGPNFQFTVIPAPGAAVLLLAAASHRSRRRGSLSAVDPPCRLGAWTTPRRQPTSGRSCAACAGTSST